MSSGPTGSRAKLAIIEKDGKFYITRFGGIVASSDSEEKLQGIFGHFKKSPFRNNFEYEEDSIQAESL